MNDCLRSLNPFIFFIWGILRACYVPFTPLGPGDTVVSNHCRKRYNTSRNYPCPQILWDVTKQVLLQTLEQLWCKGKSISKVAIPRPRENYWLAKFTLGTKHSEGPELSLLSMCCPSLPHSLSLHVPRGEVCLLGCDHKHLCCWHINQWEESLICKPWDEISHLYNSWCPQKSM